MGRYRIGLPRPCSRSELVAGVCCHPYAWRLMSVQSSRLPSSTPLNASTLPDAARRMLLQSSSRSESRATSRQSHRGEEREGGSDRALRFGGIWNKLERGVSLLLSLMPSPPDRDRSSGCHVELTDWSSQRTLASPLPHLQVLLALSAMNPSNPPAPPANPASSSKSRSMPPPPIPSAVFPSTRPAPPTVSSSRLPLHVIDSANIPAADWKGKRKSKADVLRAWRTAQCP